MPPFCRRAARNQSWLSLHPAPPPPAHPKSHCDARVVGRISHRAAPPPHRCNHPLIEPPKAPGLLPRRAKLAGACSSWKMNCGASRCPINPIRQESRSSINSHAHTSASTAAEPAGGRLIFCLVSRKKKACSVLSASVMEPQEGGGGGGGDRRSPT